MISDWQIERKGAALILGIAVADNAVLDIVSDDVLLGNCLEMLERPHVGLVHTQMGRFGEFPITLNLHHNDTVSIFVDGPDFDAPRNQSAAIWVEKNGLRDILQQIIRTAEPGAPSNGGPTTQLGSPDVSGGPPSVS